MQGLRAAGQGGQISPLPNVRHGTMKTPHRLAVDCDETPRCTLKLVTAHSWIEHVLDSEMVEELEQLLKAGVPAAVPPPSPHVIEQLRGQGFVRARIDGIVAELETPPKLDPKKKHTSPAAPTAAR